MSEALIMMLAWVGGCMLGVFFYGGLWWTVRHGVASKRPAVWFFGSLLLRTSIVLPGFYFVAGGYGERLLLCILGFLMAQIAVTRLTRSASESQTRPVGQANHAP